MRNNEPKHFKVGDHNFYIHAFGAFKAANLSGELVALFMPVVGTLLPIVGNGEGSLMDVNIDKAAPEITKAFDSLSGDKVENILKKLLISKNIAVETEENPDGEWLTENIADNIFCGEVQDMYILAFHVIQVNYNGFFKMFGNLSGAGMSKLTKNLKE